MAEPTPEERAEMEKALLSIASNQDMIQESARNMARMLHTMYQGYIEAGFSEEQAFQIVLHRGVT